MDKAGAGYAKDTAATEDGANTAEEQTQNKNRHRKRDRHRR